MTRNEVIAQLRQISTEKDEAWRLVKESKTPYCIEGSREDKQRHEYWMQYNTLRSQEEKLYAKINSALPIIVEGYLDEDDAEEDGIREIYHYVGCPDLNSHRVLQSIRYDRLQDITDILLQNTGKYIRVTIEAIDIGNRDKCETCCDRFRCLTTYSERQRCLGSRI
jgi:hypothetical protein